MARTPPSWILLLLAAALLVFAGVWLAQDDASDAVSTPEQRATGRSPLPPGGDFAGMQRDRPIEPRERPLPPGSVPPAVNPATGKEPAPARGNQ